jgi:hypothetical protein
MVYVKSMMVGIATLFASALLFIVVQAWLVLRSMKVPEGTVAVGIDVVSFAKAPRFWLVVLIGFGIGFWWQFRRSSR